MKFCDIATAVCVKLSKKETNKIRDDMFVSVGAGVSALCGYIPASSVPGGIAKVICAAAVATYFYTLRGTFNTAKKKGKCVELKFRIIGPAIVTGIVVSC